VCVCFFLGGLYSFELYYVLSFMFSFLVDWLWTYSVATWLNVGVMASWSKVMALLWYLFAFDLLLYFYCYCLFIFIVFLLYLILFGFCYI
jgi:hypothetical protein